MIKERYLHIDALKALSIILIILIHILSYSLDTRLRFQIWNYLHFVVIAFVFSSGYVLTAVYANKIKTLPQVKNWIIKRIKRLLLPYYIYLFTHFSLAYFLKNLFVSGRIKLSLGFLTASIALTGGVDLKWFVVLFLQLTLIFALFLLVRSKKTYLAISFILGSIASIIFIFKPFQPYEAFMFLSWENILFLGSLFFLFEKKMPKARTRLIYLLSSLAAFFIFLILSRGKEIVFTQNKYPPNLIYFAYGVSITTFLLFIFQSFILLLYLIRQPIEFISRYSYQLFFAHYIAIDNALSLKRFIPASFKFSFFVVSTIILSFFYLLIWIKLSRLIKSLQNSMKLK